MVESVTAETHVAEAEPTALGLDAGGWVAMAMIVVLGLILLILVFLLRSSASKAVLVNQFSQCSSQ